MKKFGNIFLVITAILLFSFIVNQKDKFVSYIVDVKKEKIVFYWKDSNGDNFSNFSKLKSYLEAKGQKLIFATNGGMYKKDASPQGLYIENGEIKNELDTLEGNGNFYLMPNGVFYISNNKKAYIEETKRFQANKNILYATQSGPMLVIDGEIHSAFKQDSKNRNIRNGVGILPNGNVIFVMSKEEVNFYEFANYFKELRCKQALYLDGFVSRTYLPSKGWKQVDGNFGVIIGVSK